MNKLHQFFSTRFGAYLVNLASARIKPGMLLEVRYWWQDWLGGPSFKGEDGYAWDIMGEVETSYPCVLVDANCIQEQITHKTSLSASALLPQYGLQVSGSFQNDYTLSVRLTGVKQKSFVNGASAPVLLGKMLGLKKSDPSKWTWVNDDLLVTESFHVTAFEATFKGGGNAGAKADYEAGNIKLSGGFTGTWSNEDTLAATGVGDVPLAVRGVKV